MVFLPTSAIFPVAKVFAPYFASIKLSGSYAETTPLGRTSLSAGRPRLFFLVFFACELSWSVSLHKCGE